MSDKNNSPETIIFKKATPLGSFTIAFLLIFTAIPVILTLSRYAKCKDEINEDQRKPLQYLRYSLTIITTMLVTTIVRAVGKQYDLLAIGGLSLIIAVINYFISLSLLKKEKCSNVKDSDQKYMTFTSRYIAPTLFLITLILIFYLANSRQLTKEMVNNLFKS